MNHMEIDWPDGIVIAPSGDEMRQLPELHCWSSGVFVARNGLVWRRFYNSQTREWAWADVPLVATIDEAGTMGYNVGWWRSMEVCIASAWLHRMEGSTSGVRERVTVELVETARPASPERSQGPHLDALEWVEGEEPDEEADTIEGETWRKLKWRVGLVPCDRRYMISSLGRLKSPFTKKVTRGFWACDSRWAATRDGLLVNLLAAAGLTEVRIAPSIRTALDALLNGVTPEALAAELGVAESTGWNYTTQAAIFAPRSELLTRVEALIHPAMWRALLALQGDARLGASLTELFLTLQQLLPPRSRALRTEHAMAELRLARLALTAP